LAGGGETAAGTGPNDIVYHDEWVTAFISLHWRVNNPGHVLVVPNTHFENVYELPDAFGEPLLRAVRRVALAMKQSYGCAGVSTAQNNEPHGNQDVWHYHTHVFPRFAGDDMYRSRLRLTTAAERRPYAEKLRIALATEAPGDATRA
jgi:histidine triad (HIT) family protein